MSSVCMALLLMIKYRLETILVKDYLCNTIIFIKYFYTLYFIVKNNFDYVYMNFEIFNIGLHKIIFICKLR